MTAGTSQPTTSVPPWNPNKPAAPTPPSGQEPRSSVNGQTQDSSANTGNFPDVTAGIRDLYDASRANPSTRDRNESDVTVVPDYPLDSLPRNATRQTAATRQTTATRQTATTATMPTSEQSRRVPASTRPSQTRPSQTRPSQSSSSSRATPRTSSSSGGPPVGIIVPASTGVIPASHVREIPQHAQRSSHPIPQSAVVSHANVSVSVNHPVSQQTAGNPRQVRTQDLNVGVVSRIDNHGPSNTNMLPDLVAHSQPQTSGRTPTNLPRNALQGSSPDPRYSHRQHESHSRQRHYRDPRYSRTHRRSRRRSHSGDDEPCKETCLKCIAVGMSFRWILVVLSLLGVCCVVTGIILAALHAAGNSFLFLAIMFIGLGVLLVVVVGVGWKCTPRGHEPLHALFGIGDFRQPRSGRRHRSHHRREGRWHGGAMYPEFQFPRPPPSYDASMRDYQQQQQQLAIAQQNQTPDLYDPDDIPIEDYSLPSSPPPSYRSRASTVRAGIQITFPPNQGGDFPDSRPPTYRSHPSNTLPGHGRTRPSLSRDDEDDDDADSPPADVAFTGSSVVVDTNTGQNATSIQIGSIVPPNQNLTVSVTTVSVTTQPATSASASTYLPQISTSVDAQDVAQPIAGVYAMTANPVDSADQVVDSVGDVEGDRVDTAL